LYIAREVGNNKQIIECLLKMGRIHIIKGTAAEVVDDDFH
jgi:hypothetical protein